ncbi:MAG: hypothetical protein ACI8XC_001875 [Gammaproteobacteria bacterium]
MNTAINIDPGKLRRIALESQGLLRSSPFGRGKNSCLKAIEHIGYVQIDTISVVERAHHHVLYSRLPNYRASFLDQLVKERKLFEYWSHAAAWLPMRDFRFALPRMNNVHGDRAWFAQCDPKLTRNILKRIKHEGPLRARDFEDDRVGTKEWWDWKPAKQALEQLFMDGELMVTRREGFQKVYDLPENVLPDWVDTRAPSIDEYANHLVDSSLRAHGLMSARSVSYLRKGPTLRKAVSEEIDRRVNEQTLISLSTGRDQLYYLEPWRLDQRAPVSMKRVRILSPFDNAVIQRDRLQDLFKFNYQIECYVPGPKRQYGYFCLPLLYRDQLVGRIDCKAYRKELRLHIISLSLEIKQDDEFYRALYSELKNFSTFNNCEEISATDPELLRRLEAN